MKAKSRQIAASHYTKPVYWTQVGAFVSTLPRQSGKTTMLSLLIEDFILKGEDYILVTHNLHMKNNISTNFLIPNNKICVVSSDANELMFYMGYNKIITNGCHLLIDEYQLIDNNVLMGVLNFDWKTVTMVGTVR
ncbi:MAG: hypothetical protein WC523_00215 [Patescibacteria group bacterium]